MNSSVLNEVERELTNVFGKSVFIKNSSSIGGGCINHATKIETNVGTFFMKWNANCPSDIFLREAESLTEMRKAVLGQIKIPEVFASKNVDSTPGFLVTEYLPASYGSPNDEYLGRGLALLHQYKSEDFGFYNDNYCGSTIQNNNWKKSWIAFFTENRLSFLLDLIKKDRFLSSSELNIYNKLLERIPELIPDDSIPVLIHGDLWSGNYMRTGNGFALIDPAAYYANREMEFAIITMFGGFSTRFYNAYNEVNPLPADWRQRNLLYQLYHVLNHYYLFGGGYQSQALSIAKQYL